MKLNKREKISLLYYGFQTSSCKADTKAFVSFRMARKFTTCNNIAHIRDLGVPSYKSLTWHNRLGEAILA